MTPASSRFSNDLRYRDPDHENQTQLTPRYVLDPIIESLGGRLELDPCTTPENPCGADRFYALPDSDGLAAMWDAETVYANPPYGKAREPWVHRCIDAADAGSKVVMLIPAATDTRIFQTAMASATAVVFVKGRVKFGIPRENGRQMAASHPSAIIGWNVDLLPCAHLGLLAEAI